MTRSVSHGPPLSDDLREPAHAAIEHAFEGWGRFDFVSGCSLVDVYHHRTPSDTGPWLACYELSVDDDGLRAWAEDACREDPTDEEYVHDLFEGWDSCLDIDSSVHEIIKKADEDGIRTYEVWVGFSPLPEADEEE